MSDKYLQLKQQIHDDLRIQNPDWVEPNGNCPNCDSYESRFAELLSLPKRTYSVIPSVAALEAIPGIA
jgi:hypothetical protein